MIIGKTENGKDIVRIRGKNSPIKDGLAQPKCKANVVTYGNIWTRQLTFEKAGEMKAGHKHEFDHLHFLANGKVRIKVYAKDRDVVIFDKEYTAPSWIKVPKEHFHDITALEDNSSGYCIQAIHNEDGNVIDTDYVNDPDWMAEVKEFEEKTGIYDETIK